MALVFGQCTSILGHCMAVTREYYMALLFGQGSAVVDEHHMALLFR